MHYRAISNTVSHLDVFRCEKINNTAKQKDGPCVECFRSNDLSIRLSRRTGVRKKPLLVVNLEKGILDCGN